jgi:hypothetical protein
MTYRKTRITADNDLDQAGATLQSHSNFLYVNAHHHLRLELSALDGFPERGDSVQVSASAELTSVERAADGRMAIHSAQDALREAKANVLAALVAMNEEANRALRLRAPRNPVQPQQAKGFCSEAQSGLHAVAEWGEPCYDLGLKKGLCDTHYKAWYRACLRDGIDRSKDFEDAQPVSRG